MITRARDELFSHINRCGVLQADDDDQRHWMDETIDYLAERYPDLSDADLQDLYAVGMRFCQPAIPHGHRHSGPEGGQEDPKAEEEESKAEEDNTAEEAGEDLVSQEVAGETASQDA